MSALRHALVLAALAGGGLVWALTGRDPGPPAPTESSPQALPRPKAPPRPASVPPVAPAVEKGEAREATAPADPRAVWGRVVHRGGEAAAGVRVTLWRLAPGFSLEPRRVQATDTDRRGRYRLYPVATRGLLAAEGKGHLAIRRLVRPGNRTDLVLLPAAELRGTVRTDLGAPVPDATVFVPLQKAAGVGALRGWAPQATARTDASGAYRLRVPAGTWSVWIFPPQHPPVRSPRPVRVEAGSVRILEHTVREGVAIRGRVVVQATGRALGGVRVHLPDNPRQAALTAPDGTFVLPGVRPGWALLWVSAPGFCGTGARVFAWPGFKAEVEVRLRRTTVVVGQVLSPAGRPLRGARVAPWPHHLRRFAERFVVETDAAGRFRLEGLPPGRYRLYAGHPDYGVVAGPPVRLEPYRVPRVELVFRRPASLAVEVRGPDGAPEPRARVTLLHTKWGLVWATGEADRSGSVLFGRLPPATYRVDCVPQGSRYAAETRNVVLSSGRRTVRIILRAGAALAGCVWAADGRRITDARVTARLARSVEPPRTVMADQAGNFVISGLRPGAPYEVIASAPGYAWASSGGVRPPRNDLVFKLTRLVELPLRIQRQDGAEPPSAISVWVVRGRAVTRKHLQLRAGEGTLLLRPGRVTLSAHTPRLVSPPVQVLLSPEGKPPPLTLQLFPAGELAGQVLSPAGRPVAGAEVRVGHGPSVRSGKQGYFHLPGLLPGRHIVTAVSGGQCARVEVQVAPGWQSACKLVLEGP